MAGAAGLFAQPPMPSPPSPYSSYSLQGAYYDTVNYDDSRRAAAPQYSPVAPVAYGPAPANGPAYGPVMNAGGLQPPVGGMGPAPAPVPAGPGPGMMGAPNPGMMPGAPMGRGGPMGPGPNGSRNYSGAWNDGNYWNSGCGNGDCGGECSRCPCGPCGPEGRIWASAELLLWWTKGQGVPPLVTSGTGVNNPGVLGQPGTSVLFGDARLGEEMRVGVRTRLGFWLDECQNWGVEGSFLYLGESSTSFSHCCTVGDVLGRPFNNVAINAPDAELVCLPGVVTGCVDIRAVSDFYSADANIRRNLCCSCASRVDFVIGFRYAHLSDSLEIAESLTNLDATRGAIGEGFAVQDNFRATNNFYGGQIGFAGEVRSGAIFIDWRALFAAGTTFRQIVIAGATTFLDPVVGGNPVTQPGGLLAQPSNIGTYNNSNFSFIPEVNANIGYAITPYFRTYVGYTFMYWTNVARAGEQINLNLDPNQLPSRTGPGTGTQPTFILRTNDFWAQGVNLGVQLRW
jgi:hypothetical protein